MCSLGEGEGPPYAKHKGSHKHLQNALCTLSLLQDSLSVVMDQTFACVLLLLSLSAISGKYVYIQEGKTWHEAQRYCRLFHTDLAPVSNAQDMQRLRRLSGDIDIYIWIGLERSSTDSKKWMWSGGGAVSTFFWATGQPNNRQNEDYGIINYEYKWHDAIPGYEDPFFCYSVVVVRERKTWEEAVIYCREHHRDLASVASDTEMMLIQKELSKNATTAHVWIGLHFFPGGWLWTDGQSLSYEAWGREGKPECPKVERECAALQVTGGTQSNNGTDATPDTDAAAGKGTVHTNKTGSYGVETAAHNAPHIHGFPGDSSDAAAHVRESAWEARNCEERHHFICY